VAYTVRLPEGRLQVPKHFDHVGVVRAMEGGQLIQDVVSSRNTRMAEDLPASHHLKGDAAKAQADLDAGMTRILALSGPLGRQRLEVVVAHDQIVGNAQDGGAEGTVAMAHQWAIGFVYLIALVTGWSQASTAGDGLGVGIVLDGPHLPREVGSADDVDTGKGEQQHVRSLHEAAGDVAFQELNFLGFSQAVVVQSEGDTEVLAGGNVARRGLFGPVEDSVDRALLEADAGLAQ